MNTKDIPLRVTIWNEFVHEKDNPEVARHYPDGIHQTIAAALRPLLPSNSRVETATLQDPEHGLPALRIAETDVLVWWGHAAHDEVSDDIVARVHQAVLAGMGLIVLHSGHGSKIFRQLMGTSCMLRWREAAERERLWVVAPGHPITRGLDGECFELPHAEMYGEFFDIPTPDELVFISWFEGGEVFRSGCTFRRGRGKIFYFRPGHETYPIYHHPLVQRVIANAVEWAHSTGSPYWGDARNITDPLSPLHSPPGE
ncbi:MAG: ThuA domain-containing protein [Planctomycetales bacterium]|nr:ThuA domain-containing protein [Planctomycetales bacterium]